MSQSTSLANGEHCTDTDVNILLLGETGVGKTTFINSLANYLTYDSFHDAMNGDLQVTIPSSFSFINEDTGDEMTVTVGENNLNEDMNLRGASVTQQCQAFFLTIGNRKLRLIDTPGIGDTRGVEQDERNFQEILTCINQYSHLNGICILLKPDVARLSIQFRFCVNQLLRYLHGTVVNNLYFIFTNGRTTFYRPGTTSRILRALLNEHREQHHKDIPFNNENTFILDNESFRCLALHRSGIEMNHDYLRAYEESWNRSVKVVNDLLSHVVLRPLHGVQQIVTLNQAAELIRKLPRPIAETVRLIEQNIELTKQQREHTRENGAVGHEGIPQNTAHVVCLDHPRTVCTNDRCRRVTNIAAEARVEYSSICHDHCYLTGVVQEILGDRKLADCEVMDYQTGICGNCGCQWRDHMHITYECIIDRTVIESSMDETTARNGDPFLATQQHLDELVSEQEEILQIYAQLIDFHRTNALIPIDDQVISYFQLCIDEEQRKAAAGADTGDIIKHLEEAKAKLAERIQACLESSRNTHPDADNSHCPLTLDEVSVLFQRLYNLPNTGQCIRAQVEGIGRAEGSLNHQRGKPFVLPPSASSSQLMQALLQIMNEQQND